LVAALKSLNVKDKTPRKDGRPNNNKLRYAIQNKEQYMNAYWNYI
jgi:hypothetical protein